jgi:hypothetical protein
MEARKNPGRHRRRTWLLAGGVAILVAAAAAAFVVSSLGGADPIEANLWIDPDGGTCTRAEPAVAYADDAACAGLDAAYRAARAGDAVKIRAGRYGDQAVKASPSAAAPPVTFGVQPAARVKFGTLTLNGSHMVLSGKGARVTATTLNHDGRTTAPVEQVTVEDITVDHGGATGMAGFLRSADGITWRRVELCCNRDGTLVLNDGANTGGAFGVSDWTIDGSTFHDSSLPEGSANHTECIYAQGVVGLTIRRSHFYRCAVFDVFVTMSEHSPEGSRLTLENNLFESPTTFEDKCCSAYSVLLRGNEPDDGNSPAIDDWDIRYNTFEGGLALGVPSANPIADGGLRVVGNALLAGATCREGATYAHNVYGGQTCSGENEVASTPDEIKAGMVGPTGCCRAGNDYRLTKESVLVDRGDPGDHPKVDAWGARAEGAPDAGMDELGGR